MKVFNKEQKNKETKLNREYLSSDDNTKIVNNVINYFTSHFYKEEGLDETKKDKYIKKLKKILQDAQTDAKEDSNLDFMY